jgi:hypothetical protein
VIRRLRKLLLQLELRFTQHQLELAQDDYDLAVVAGDTKACADASLFYAQLQHEAVRLQQRIARLNQPA